MECVFTAPFRGARWNFLCDSDRPMAGRAGAALGRQFRLPGLGAGDV
ncbi:hypothetical protein ABID19_001794 [Mesorhizobium robiniae]|uniref:Uncharacterized protein n=1 Tax=Mesorhizobium robiniae TaxID=559315 RepID=A0ABV2GKV3_9HYPH